VKVSAALRTQVTPDAVHREVGTLDHYPQWLEIVERVEPAPAVSGDEGPAWFVQLRGKIGPLSRAKKLRMVRTSAEAPSQAVFERREADGKSHSAWILRADITPTKQGTELEMSLYYGGGLFDGVVERLLKSEIESAQQRLKARLER